MPFLGMMTNQNWLAWWNHFKLLPGSEVSPGRNVFVLLYELAKASGFLFAFGLKIVHIKEKLGCSSSV